MINKQGPQLFSNNHSNMQSAPKNTHSSTEAVAATGSQPYSDSNLHKLYSKYQTDSKHLQKHTQKKLVLQSVLKRFRSGTEQHYLNRKQVIQTHISSQISQNKLIECPICLGFITHAVSTFCGHTFCKKCLYERQALTPKCRICYFDLSKYQPCPCLAIDDVLLRYIQNSNNSLAKCNYQEKVRISLEWESKRKLNFEQVAAGINIDVRDQSSKWIKGVVTQVLTQPSRMIIVQYTEGIQTKKQVFQDNSNRLAPFKFYTTKALGVNSSEFFRINNSDVFSMNTTEELFLIDFSDTLIDQQEIQIEIEVIVQSEEARGSSSE